MKISGRARLQLTDFDGNVEYEYEQHNTIGFLPYYYLTFPGNIAGAFINNSYSGYNTPPIFISDTKSELNKFSYYISSTISDATFNVSGTRIPNEYWPQLTNDTTNSRYIVQYKNRFQPSTTTRTINTISLGKNSAGLLLTTPCTQSPTQILDVFYSIYIPYSSSKANDVQFNQRYLNSNVLLSWLFGRGNYDPIYTPGTSNVINNGSNGENAALGIFPLWQNNLTINNKAAAVNGSMSQWVGLPSTTVNLCQGTSLYSYSLQNGDYIGSLISSLGACPNNVSFNYTTNSYSQLLAINPIAKPTDSPIQSYYLKNPSYPTIYPYLDPSSIGASTGTVSFDGSSWTDADIPLMFKINIANTGTGALATTSYNFSVRPTFGFANNSISSENYMQLYNVTSTLAPTNQSNTTSTHYNYPSAPFYTNCAPMRDDKSFIVGDMTGVSIINAYTSNYVNFDATTTPAMPTSGIEDYCVGSDGTVYVATNDQGLYVISSDRTTVTQHLGTSIDASLTNNTCYSVAVKDNGDVWVGWNGALAKLSGGTWTIYNSTTTPSFTYVGISDANWSHINKIFVNKTNSVDQLMIFRNDVNTFVWWGPTTPTPVAVNNAMNGFALPAVALDRAIKHLPTTDVWFINTNYNNVPNSSAANGNTTIFSFGNTTPTATFSPFSPTLSINVSSGIAPQAYLIMEPLLYNGAYVMHCAALNYYNGIGSSYNHLYITSTGTIRHDPFNGSHGNFGIGGGMCFISSKISCVFGLNSVTNGGSLTNNTSSANLFNLNDVVGSSNPEAWDNYGWNSTTSQWVKDYVGNKPMHTDSEVFYEGLKISFADAPSNSNFNNGEYWFLYVYKGLHKDNSTSATFGMSMNTRDSYLTADLLASSVPSSGFGSVTNQTMNFYTLDNTKAPIYSYKGNSGIGNSRGSYNVIANNCPSEQIFSGDYQVNFNATSKAYSTSTSQWCQFFMVDTTLASPTSSTAGVYGFIFDFNGFSVYEGGARKTTAALFAASDIFSFNRTGSTVEYLLNGTVIYTSTVTNSNPMRAYSIFNSEYIRTFTNINCTYNETRPVLTIGIQANSTGIFDQEFAMVEAWLTNPPSYNITIAGTPAVVWTDPSHVPARGEVTLLQKTGWLIFNTADAGKAVTSSVMILKEM